MSFNPYNGAKQMPVPEMQGVSENNDTKMSNGDFFQAFLEKSQD
jgi:hypothetical protein